MSDQAFPRQRRVTASADYTRSFAEGRRFSSRCFRVHWCPGLAPARLGLAVSRKVSTRAVDRNRIKRCVRESFRHACNGLPDGDAVLVAQRAAVALSPAELRDELDGIWRKIAGLPTSHGQGTIRPATVGRPRPPVLTSSEAPSQPAAERSPPAEPTSPSA